MSSRNIEIIVDHPFLFLIYHSESKIILYEGIINEPQEVSNVKCDAIKNEKPIKQVLNDIYNIDIRNQQLGLNNIAENRNGSSSTRIPTKENHQTISTTNLPNNLSQTMEANNQFSSFSTGNKQSSVSNNQQQNHIHQQNSQMVHHQTQPLSLSSSSLPSSNGQLQNVNYNPNQQPSATNINLNSRQRSTTPRNNNDQDAVRFPDD